MRKVIILFLTITIVLAAAQSVVPKVKANYRKNNVEWVIDDVVGLSPQVANVARPMLMTGYNWMVGFF